MYIEGLVEDLNGLQGDLDNSLPSLHPCQREIVRAVLEILKYSFGKVSETNFGCCQDICLATTCWDLPEGYDTAKLQDDVAFIISLSNIGFTKGGAKPSGNLAEWWDSNDQQLTKGILDCISDAVLGLLGSEGLDILDETDPAAAKTAQALLAAVLFLVFGDPVIILHNSQGLLSDDNLEVLLNDAIKNLAESLGGTPVAYQELLMDLDLYNDDPTDLSATNFTPERFRDVIRWLLQDFQYSINQVHDLKLEEEGDGSGEDPCPDNQFGIRFPSWPGFLWMLANVTVGVFGGAAWGILVKKRWSEEQSQSETNECGGGAFPPIGINDINHPAWMDNFSAPSHPFADQAFRVSEIHAHHITGSPTALESLTIQFNQPVHYNAPNTVVEYSYDNGATWNGAIVTNAYNLPTDFFNVTLSDANGNPIAQGPNGWHLRINIFGATSADGTEMIPWTDTWTSVGVGREDYFIGLSGDEGMRVAHPYNDELSEWLLGTCRCSEKTFNLGIDQFTGLDDPDWIAQGNDPEGELTTSYFVVEYDNQIYYTTVGDFVLGQDGHVYWNGEDAYTGLGLEIRLQGFNDGNPSNCEDELSGTLEAIQLTDLCCELEIDECGKIYCCKDNKPCLQGQIALACFIGDLDCGLDLHCGVLFEDLCIPNENSGEANIGTPCAQCHPALNPHEVIEGETYSNVMLLTEYFIGAYEQYFGDDFKVIFAAIGATGLLNKKTADFCGFLHPDAMCTPFLEKFVCQIIMSQCETECIEVEAHGKIDDQPHPRWVDKHAALVVAGELASFSNPFQAVFDGVIYSGNGPPSINFIQQNPENEMAAFTVNGDHLVAAINNTGGPPTPNSIILNINERPIGATLPTINGEEVYYMFYDAQLGRAFTVSDQQHASPNDISSQPFFPLTNVVNISGSSFNGLMFSPFLPDYYYALQPISFTGGGGGIVELNRILLRADGENVRRGFQIYNDGEQRCLVWNPDFGDPNNCQDCAGLPNPGDTATILYVLDADSAPSSLPDDECGQDANNSSPFLGSEPCANQKICVGDACCIWIKEDGTVMADGTKVGTVGIVTDYGSAFDDSTTPAGMKIGGHPNWENHNNFPCLWASLNYGNGTQAGPVYWDVYDFLIKEPKDTDVILHHDPDGQPFLDCQEPNALRNWFAGPDGWQLPLAIFDADPDNPTGHNCCPKTFTICDCTYPIPEWLNEWFDKYCCYLYLKLPYDPCNPNDCMRYTREEQIMLVTALWDLVEAFLNSTPFGIAFGFKDWPNSMTRYLNVIPFGKQLIPNLNDTFGGWEVGCVPEPIELVLPCTGEVCVDCCEWMCECCDPCADEEEGSGSGSGEEPCGDNNNCDCCDCAVGVWKQPVSGGDCGDGDCAGYPLGAVVHYPDEDSDCYVSLIGCEPNGGNYEPIFITVSGEQVLNAEAWEPCPSTYPECPANIELDAGCCCVFGEGSTELVGDIYYLTTGCSSEIVDGEQYIDGQCLEICTDAEAPCPNDWRYKICHEYEDMDGNGQQQQQNRMAMDVIGPITRDTATGLMDVNDFLSLESLMELNNAFITGMQSQQRDALYALNDFSYGPIDRKLDSGLKASTINAMRRVAGDMHLREQLVKAGLEGNRSANMHVDPEEICVYVNAGEQQKKPDSCISVCLPTSAPSFGTTTEWEVTLQFLNKQGEWEDCGTDLVCLCCVNICDEVDFEVSLNGPQGEALVEKCCVIGAAGQMGLSGAWATSQSAAVNWNLIVKDDNGMLCLVNKLPADSNPPTFLNGAMKVTLEPSTLGNSKLMWNNTNDLGGAYNNGDKYALQGFDLDPITGLVVGGLKALEVNLLETGGTDFVDDCGEFRRLTFDQQGFPTGDVPYQQVAFWDTLGNTPLCGTVNGITTNYMYADICVPQGGSATGDSSICASVGNVFEMLVPEYNECPENEEGNGKCLTISGPIDRDLLPLCAEYRWSVNDSLYYGYSWEALEFGYQTICVPYGQTTLKLEYRACEGDWKECWSSGELEIEDCCEIDCDTVNGPIAWTVTAPTNAEEACCDVNDGQILKTTFFDKHLQDGVLNCGDKIDGDTSGSDLNSPSNWYNCTGGTAEDGQCYTIQADDTLGWWWTAPGLDCACWKFVLEDQNGNPLAEWLLANTMPSSPSAEPPFLNLCLPTDQENMVLSYQYSEDGGATWQSCWSETISTGDCCEIDCGDYFVTGAATNLDIVWTADGCCDDTNIADCSGTANEDGECATVDFSVKSGMELCEAVTWHVELWNDWTGTPQLVDVLYTSLTPEDSISFNETRCLAQGQYGLVVTLTDSTGVVICNQVAIPSSTHNTAQCCNCELSLEILGSKYIVNDPNQSNWVANCTNAEAECCCLVLADIKHYGTEYDPLGGSTVSLQDPCDEFTDAPVALLPGRCVKVAHGTDCSNDPATPGGLYWKIEMNRRYFGLQGAPEQFQWKYDPAAGFGTDHTCQGPCGDNTFPNGQGNDDQLAFIDGLKPPTWILTGVSGTPLWKPENDIAYAPNPVQVGNAPDWNHCLVPPQVITINGQPVWYQWEITLVGYTDVTMNNIFCCEKVIWTADGVAGSNYPNDPGCVPGDNVYADLPNNGSGECIPNNNFAFAFSDNVQMDELTEVFIDVLGDPTTGYSQFSTDNMANWNPAGVADLMDSSGTGYNFINIADVTAPTDGNVYIVAANGSSLSGYSNPLNRPVFSYTNTGGAANGPDTFNYKINNGVTTGDSLESNEACITINLMVNTALYGDCWTNVVVFHRDDGSFGGQGTAQVLGGAGSQLVIEYSASLGGSGGGNAPVLHQIVCKGGADFIDTDPNALGFQWTDDSFVEFDGRDNLQNPWTFKLANYEYENNAWDNNVTPGGPPPAAWVDSAHGNPDHTNYDGKKTYARVYSFKIDTYLGTASNEVTFRWEPDPAWCCLPISSGGMSDMPHGGHKCAPGNAEVDTLSNEGFGSYFMTSVPPEGGVNIFGNYRTSGPDCCEGDGGWGQFPSGTEMGTSILAMPNMGVMVVNSIGQIETGLAHGYSVTAGETVPNYGTNPTPNGCNGIPGTGYCNGVMSAMWSANPFRYLSGRGSDGYMFGTPNGVAMIETKYISDRCDQIGDCSTEPCPDGTLTGLYQEPWMLPLYVQDAPEAGQVAFINCPAPQNGASDDTYTVDAPGGVSGNSTDLMVLQNDFIANYGTNPNDGSSVQIYIQNAPTLGGVLTVNGNDPNGYDNYITYTSAAGSGGLQDTFTYMVIRSNGPNPQNSNVATVTVNIST